MLGRIEKFLVEATLLNNTDNTDLDISQFIKNINIKKNYLENSFPLFVIQMMLTDAIRNTIRDNDILIDLKIESYVDTDTETESDNEGITIEDVVLHTIIKPYIKEYSASSIMKEEDDEFTEDNVENTVKLVPYEITGIPQDLILKNANVVNEIYEDAKMDDILVNIISSVERNAIFIDRSDNVAAEKSLIIPPFNIVKTIRYLQEVYGIYNTEVGIFFDIDRTNIFKLRNTEREYKNKLEIIVKNPEEVNDSSVFLAPQTDGTGDVRLYLKVNPAFSSIKDINMDTIGQTSVFNSYDYNLDGVKRIYENETDNRKVRYFWNDYQNKLFEESFLSNNKNQEFVNVIVQNISPNYFNIDTLYTIDSSTPYINGSYMIYENAFSFSTDDYMHYTSMINLKLIKL
jgi:hypothetical protein